MSMPSRSSSLPVSALPVSALPGSSRSAARWGAFPPPPKSVRIWVVSETPEAAESVSAVQAAQADAKPMRSWQVLASVFVVFLAVGALVAIARLVQEQIGN